MSRLVAPPADTLRTGRWVGALFLAQMLIVPAFNFAVLAPVFAPPGFLEQATPRAQAFGLAIVLTFAVGMLGLWTQVVAWTVVSRGSRRLALALVALAAAGLAVAVVEAAALWSMLALSKAWIAASGDATLQANAVLAASFEPARAVASAGRNGVHYVGLMLAGITLLVFHATAMKYRLVPRVIAGFGVAASTLQVGAVAAPLFGGTVVFALLAPLGVAQLALIVWLLAKGFARPVTAARDAPPP